MKQEVSFSFFVGFSEEGTWLLLSMCPGVFLLRQVFRDTQTRTHTLTSPLQRKQKHSINSITVCIATELGAEGGTV